MNTIAPNINTVIVLDTESDSKSNTNDSLVANWYRPSNEAPTIAPPLVPAPPPAIEPGPVVDSLIPKSPGFDLGASLIYIDGNGSSETVVYEGAMPDNLHHTIRQKDGTKLNIHDFYLQIKHQPDLSNIHSTLLDYCKEVGCGITREEADQLAHPRILSLIQQELMDWHHQLYHLLFPKIFCLADYGLLPKHLLDCTGCLPLCIACQFGTAHRRSWRIKRKLPNQSTVPSTFSLAMVSLWIKLCQLSLA